MDDPAQTAGAGDPGRPPRSPDRLSVYLQPGQVHASARPTTITTVLGSCVSVCLYDPATRAGGMNHFLLPIPVPRERSARFGNVAMEELFASLGRLCAPGHSLRAKVFGGASVLGTTRAASRRPLGEDNVRVALDMLLEKGIPVVDGDVGGSRGRKLVFHTDDGSAWMRTL
jgi:chemotaxis protein CheD